jgi:glycosyltransferase involved in cell wall biosynthesis
MTAAVDILMPTYNAAPWLDDFMNSLLRQDFEDWRLIVRDDGSRDDTPARLAEWQERLGDRMVVLPDDGRGNVGILEGVTILLKASDAAWIMLADQDDVWLDRKVSRMVAEMRAVEATHGASTPIALCSDAIVVDADLHELDASWWKSNWMSPLRRPRPRCLALESPALGCTMIFNRALADLAAPISPSAYFQDWWLALTAASFGALHTVREPTILHRRHGQNQSVEPGDGKLSSALVTVLTRVTAMRERLRDEIERVGRQAEGFLARFGDRLPPGETAAIRALARLQGQGALAARLSIVRHGLWYSTLPRNIRLIALL